MVGDEDERAVSPVIGVILMVAITVILAAVIAAFVLDMGPEGPEPTAVVDVDEQNDTTVVELRGTTDADGILIKVDNGSGNEFESIIETTGGSEGIDHSGNESATVYAYSGGGDNIEGLDDVDEYTIAEEFDLD
ncbi:hypothetical protein C493_08561 [Natronolimnohabitans innermongolicus JCM 12255]|uniref:Archaeal Type IV pilin N-terminal domain-containing protein n=1 Tax=Natronolimnohabitans innermongolicus JCM 12255 TaxID=1227499 RepID=L9X6Y7_9EURY|nr:hypothetical protein C493_08561 [Natronolimnohabitans innermongolicus JCM 12255]